jgi:hypothetical protein
VILVQTPLQVNNKEAYNRDSTFEIDLILLVQDVYAVEAKSIHHAQHVKATGYAVILEGHSGHFRWQNCDVLKGGESRNFLQKSEFW